MTPAGLSYSRSTQMSRQSVWCERCCKHTFRPAFTGVPKLGVKTAMLLSRRCSPMGSTSVRCSAKRSPAPFANRHHAVCSPSPSRTSTVTRAIEIDMSDPDTQISAAGIFLGLLFGIGAPYFYIQRMDKDEGRLEELRALNRAHFEKTGEYLTEDEIAAFRKPKWTDRREWADDD